MFGSNLPGLSTHRKPKRMALDDAQLASLRFGGPINIKSGTLDSGHTGATKLLRPGGIFVAEVGATGYYVHVTDWVNADKGSLGSVRSAEAPDADWASKVVKLFRNGVQVASVTLGGADDTVAEVVTALNANASFRNHALASADTELVITDDNPGAGGGLTVEINLLTAYATANGAASSIGHAKSAVPDVRIIGEEVSMIDSAGNDIAGHSSYNFVAGNFKASNLIVGGTQAATLAAVPAWVRAIFEARGSTFRLGA